ncbi:MAG: transcriptional regulator [Deltaproteobacteria bacterium]|nr:transcriptional regulator [Deltaproteobacteria bacterium]
MKMIWIVYDIDREEEVMEVLNRSDIDAYTKWERVLGEGKKSEPKLGTHAWPGFNSALAIAAEEDEALRLLEGLRELARGVGYAGIKVFVWPLEEII